MSGPWRPHATSLVALTAVLVAGLLHSKLSVVSATSAVLLSAVLLSADAPRRFLVWSSAILLPFGLMAALVALAGPSREGEVAWIEGAFWAASRERLESLALLMSRMCGFAAVGWHAATRARKASIERFAGQLGLPPLASELLVSAVATRSLVLGLARTLAEHQQLRGVPVAGTLRQRLRSATLMTLPLAAELFTEAAASSAARERRVALRSGRGTADDRAPLGPLDAWAIGVSVAVLCVLVATAL